MSTSNFVIQIFLCAHMGLVSSFGDFALPRTFSKSVFENRLNYGRKQQSASPLPFALYSGPNAKITENSIHLGEEDVQDTSIYNTLPRLFVGELSSTINMVMVKGSNMNRSRLQRNSRVTLSPEQSHYLIKVMRIFSKRSKRLIRAFDGMNGEWLCRVIEPTNGDGGTNRQRRMKNNGRGKGDSETVLQVECIQMLRKQNLEDHHDDSGSHSKATNPWLFFAPIKKQRAKVMVEKCTELGAGLFFPVVTDNTDASAISTCIIGDDENETKSTSSVDSIMFEQNNSRKGRKSSGGDLEKLSLISCEAAEQSEQLSVPAFITSHECVRSGTDLLQEWTRPAPSLLRERGRILMICRERTEDRISVKPVLQAMNNAYNNDPSATFAFFVGPEGGWSKEEEIIFDKYCMNHPDTIMSVSLGSNVLRAETAAMLAIGSCSLWSSTTLD